MLQRSSGTPWKLRNPITMVENVNLRKDGREVVLETSGQPFLMPPVDFSGTEASTGILPSARRWKKPCGRLGMSLSKRSETYSQSVCS